MEVLWTSFLTIIQELEDQEEDIMKKEMSLVGFNNNTIYVVSIIILLVMEIGSIVMTNLVVVDVLAHYNVIFCKL